MRQAKTRAATISAKTSALAKQRSSGTCECPTHTPEKPLLVLTATARASEAMPGNGVNSKTFLGTPFRGCPCCFGARQLRGSEKLVAQGRRTPPARGACQREFPVLSWHSPVGRPRAPLSLLACAVSKKSVPGRAQAVGLLATWRRAVPSAENAANLVVSLLSDATFRRDQLHRALATGGSRRARPA